MRCLGCLLYTPSRVEQQNSTYYKQLQNITNFLNLKTQTAFPVMNGALFPCPVVDVIHMPVYQVPIYWVPLCFKIILLTPSDQMSAMGSLRLCVFSRFCQGTTWLAQVFFPRFKPRAFNLI